MMVTLLPAAIVLTATSTCARSSALLGVKPSKYLNKEESKKNKNFKNNNDNNKEGVRIFLNMWQHDNNSNALDGRVDAIILTRG